MSELLRITKVGDFGVNTDIGPSDLEAQYFTSGNNFKLVNDSIESFGGYTALANIQAGAQNHIRYFKISGTNYYLAAGTSSIGLFNGTAWTNVSSTYMSTNPPSTGNPIDWSSCLLGEFAIFNNLSYRPEYYDKLTGKMVPLKWSPTVADWNTATKQCRFIRSHNTFLFALGMIEGGVDMPTTYRWSNPADINGLPYTWDETDISGIAGTAQLAGNGGPILDGLSLREDFVIYSRNAIDVLTYTGDEFIWSRRTLASTVGILSSRCVVSIGTAHIFLTDNDIMINDGNSVKSILTRRMKKRIFGTMDATAYDKCYMIVHEGNKEIWTCVCTSGFTTPNLAFVYNWIEDKVYTRDLSLYSSGSLVAGSDVAHMTYGPILNSSTTNTWATATGSWAQQTKKWNYNQSSPFSYDLIGIGATNIKNMSPSSSSVYNTFLERVDYPIEGEVQVCTLTRVYPHIKSNGSVLINVGSKLAEDAPVSWNNPVVFNSRTDRKIDFRSTGMLHCWRIESIGSSPFSLLGLDIEYEKNGVR